MCVPPVNYTRQNCSAATEKLTFECEKSFSGPTANLHQQNLFMTSGIIFASIP